MICGVCRVALEERYTTDRNMFEDEALIIMRGIGRLRAARVGGLFVLCDAWSACYACA